MFIGGAAVLVPHSLRLILLGGWIGKELFADVAGCGLRPLVALDSAADLSFAVLGFVLAQRACAQMKAST